MADFNISYGKTAINEGGYTSNEDDNGNWTSGMKGHGLLAGTNYGISAPVLSQYLKRVATALDMKNMTIDTAKLIYRANYWNAIKGDLIKSQEFADSLYDSAVNMGTKTAITLCQRAIGMTETGKMDNATLKKINNE